MAIFPEQIAVFGSGSKCTEISCVMANYFKSVLVNPVIPGIEHSFQAIPSPDEITGFKPNLLYDQDYQQRLYFNIEKPERLEWILVTESQAFSMITGSLKVTPASLLMYFRPGPLDYSSLNEHGWGKFTIPFHYAGNWRNQRVIEAFPSQELQKDKRAGFLKFMSEKAGKKILEHTTPAIGQIIVQSQLDAIRAFTQQQKVPVEAIAPLTGKVIWGPSKGLLSQLGIPDDKLLDINEVGQKGKPISQHIETKKGSKTSKFIQRSKKITSKARKIKSIRQRFDFLVSRKNSIGDFYRIYFSAQQAMIQLLLEKYHLSIETLDIIYSENLAYQRLPSEWLPIFTAHFKPGSGNNHERPIKNSGFPSVSYFKGAQENIDLQKFQSRVIWKNPESRIYDLGEGVLNFEIDSRMNILGPLVMEGLEKAYDLAENKYKGLVIANQGNNFSVGANLGIIFLHVIDRDYDQLAHMIDRFQFLIQKARYSAIPVVVAPHRMSLGGAVELSLHADGVCPWIETYAGLVESRVGLIPGGGGTTALAIKGWQAVNDDHGYDILIESFRSMLLGKMSESALEAIKFRYFPSDSFIVYNYDHQVSSAKKMVLDLINKGYHLPSKARVNINNTGKILLEKELEKMAEAHNLTSYQVEIGQRILDIMTNADEEGTINEATLLEKEKETFLHLLGRRKTLERIWTLFTRGTPIIN